MDRILITISRLHYMQRGKNRELGAHLADIPPATQSRGAKCVCFWISLLC